MTRKQKKRIINNLKDRLKRGLAGTLALYMFLTSLMVFAPTWWNDSYALTGGPSQPEVQSFEPIGTSDMVDLFSGDFTYNIPLLDVEGYPINLAYHSGVTMDQEASWVGLGWNVNVGTVNRGLRGLPDDFNGDEVVTEMNIKPNITVGITADVGDIEVLGKKIDLEKIGLSLNANVGINYNNYNGIGFSIGVGASKAAKFNFLGFGPTVGLGLNSTSSGGLNVAPSLSLSRQGAMNQDGVTKGLSLKVGSSFNSRQGLSTLSVGVNMTAKDEDFTINDDGFIESSVRASGATGATANFNLMQPTYTPTISQSMQSFAISGRVKWSVPFFGTDIGLGIGANYAEQRLAPEDKNKSVPSYGYLFSHNAQNKDDARMDFNRENEGSVTPSTPNLALTNYTYDIFSVSGQGAGGSYRPYRGQIGYVYNNSAKSFSVDVPFTVELGAAGLAHVGGEISVSVVDSKSGPWRDDSNRFKGENKAIDKLSFENTGSNSDFEYVSFMEANEMSVDANRDLYEDFGGDDPVRIKLHEVSDYNVEATTNLVVGNNYNQVVPIQDNFKTARDKRNITIQNLSIGEVKGGFGLDDFKSDSYAQSNAKNYHLGQIVSLGTDGMRYIYGQPAYNKLQKEVTFAVGQTVEGEDFTGSLDYDAGLITYSPGLDNSTLNNWGLDHYFQRVTTPAFSHSFLLTAIVSDDYVDVDGERGLSEGDLGSYTKFIYDRIDNYKWRVPVEPNTASYNEGLKGDLTDDKASYLYGEKEVWYLDTIETKNFIAVFEKDDREDAFGVLNENGGIDENVPLQYLKKISLFSKQDIKQNGSAATPLKEVHFVYDYSLCPNIPNSSNNGGKLTLKKIYFTYRDSQKGKLSPYEFTYDHNYSYDLKAYDRWGNYMPNDVSNGYYNDTILATFEYPYTDQDRANSDDYSSAWTLSQIDLPSGGKIIPEFEADDYAYVQNKEAMSMAKIVNVGMYDSGSGQKPDNSSDSVKSVSSSTLKNKRIYFEKDSLLPVSMYVSNIDNLYFRCLMEFDESDGTLPQGRYDYVSGYAEIQSYGEDPDDSSLGWILLKPVAFNDQETAKNKNPISLAGVQFARLYLSRYAWDNPAFNENQNFAGEMINSLFQTFANFVEGFKNPNKTIYDKGRGVKIVLGKSWMRLNVVDKKKIGGGTRVKSIRMYDNWATMTGDLMTEADYGQEYDYTLDYYLNGENVKMSSGVAAYEPQLGGDENPFKQPVFHSDKKWFAPDDRFYQETPFGESFFPSASVGYSKVTVKNLTRFDDTDADGIQDPGEQTTVIKNATGAVVHEFYTAKEFPTITKRTDFDNLRHKTDPYSLRSLFKIETNDFFTGSQGFVVQNNDMHGKPKSQKVYQENQTEPITKVEYFYKHSQGPEPGTKQLANDVKVIYADGTVDNEQIGVHFDLVADFQESKTRIYNAGLSVNLDVIPLAVYPLTVPTFWPSFSSEKTMFRSATMTKVVQKFGVLDSTVATDLGSRVTTKNLAYDAETGQVLLTETQTNFDDKVYSMNFPAYWYYDNMGPAYQNIGYRCTAPIFLGQMILPSNHHIVVGDEIKLKNSTLTGGSGSFHEKAWVTEVTGNVATVVLADGTIPPDNAYYFLKVLRSGRRNMQSQMMASVTTLSNPINSFDENIYENVLQASAIEFTDEWRSYCDCNGDVATASSNPYFLGIKGSYRPVVSYLHLSDRTQSDNNNNTNIRKDGVFKSYRPYYKLNAADHWEIDRRDWTYTAEVTEFNPFGQELQNEDALGRESAAAFGFNQTLAKAVAANAGYRDIGFSSFEDDDFSDCADNHFKFEQTNQRVFEDAHTGRYSIQVTTSNSATLKRDLARCDQTGCNLDISFVDEGSLLDISVTGGTEPYTVTYSIISGNPIIVPYSDGPKVDYNGTYRIEFRVIDAEGCQAIEILNVHNGVIVNE